MSAFPHFGCVFALFFVHKLIATNFTIEPNITSFINESFFNFENDTTSSNKTQERDGIPDWIEVIEIRDPTTTPTTTGQPAEDQPTESTTPFIEIEEADSDNDVDREGDDETTTSSKPENPDDNEVYPERYSSEDMTVTNTSGGFIRGRTHVAYNGKLVDEYLGIPYAEPPIGELRFRVPVTKAPWRAEILNAWEKPSPCMQSVDTYLGDFAGAKIWNADTEMSEDCLYLNIWVPRPRPTNAPVMIWFHGGAFSSGSGSLDVYNGSVLSCEQNVIVVSIQYRLGVFGFFYLETEDSPGNQGLHDQIFAMRWIQENIANFGGHPNYVTLFGHDAGAASIGLHLVSKKSHPYFIQAIMQGGNPISEWVTITREEALNRSTDFANRLDCPSESIFAVECLRAIDARTLLEEVPTPAAGSLFEYHFLPVIDGDLLSMHPKDALKYGYFKRTNLLLGATSHEGSMYLPYAMPEIFQLYGNVSISASDLPRLVHRLFLTLKQIELDALIFLHQDSANEEQSQNDILQRIIGERYITCGIHHLAQAYTKFGSPVYMYEFAHRSANTPWPLWAGVEHNHDLAYVFGLPFDQSRNYSEGEQELSRRMMTYWANFARTGNPNLQSSGSFTKTFWPSHTLPGKEQLVFKDTHDAMDHYQEWKHCLFWDEYLPKLSGAISQIATDHGRSDTTNCVQQCSCDAPDTSSKDDGSVDLLEMEDEWMLELEQWRRDHAQWRKEFQHYQEAVTSARQLGRT